MGLCDGGTLQEILVEYAIDTTKLITDPTLTWNDVKDVTGTLSVSGGDKQVVTFRTNGVKKTALIEGDESRVDLQTLVENSASSFLEFLTDTFDGTSGLCFYLRWALNKGASGALRKGAKVAVITNPHWGGDPNASQFNNKTIQMAIDPETGINRDTVP